MSVVTLSWLLGRHERIEQLAEVVIDSGAAIIDTELGILLVADTTILSAVANGIDTTPTLILQRNDGRSAAIYIYGCEPT